LTSDIDQLTAARRGLENLESEVVRRYLADPEDVSGNFYELLRYVLCFARLLSVTNPDGNIVDVTGVMGGHPSTVERIVTDALALSDGLGPLMTCLPELIDNTRALRASILEQLTVDRSALEEAVTTRLLAIASGGGGGAGYVYLGAYTLLDRNDLIPSLMVGTSMGSLMSIFRSRTRHYDLAVAVAAAKELSWKDVFRVLETESRYGLPATLRMYLQSSLGPILNRDLDKDLWLSDMEIPLHVMVTGITVDALKYDLDFYEHLMDGSLARSGTRAAIKGTLRGLGILREFLSTPEALKEIVLGRDEGTEDFNAIDAAGFSSAIPGVLHYDVLRDDNRMKALLDSLYARYGITRLGEGGLVSNVPARSAWVSITQGQFSNRQPFVVALDCFAPNPRKLAWYPIQQMVRTANVERDRKYSDVYIPMRPTLSPLNLVPPTRDAVLAMKWGEEAVAPHIPFIKEMMRPVAVMSDL